MNDLRIEDIYWIAGFLEGEAHFGIVRTSIYVAASQVEKDPIDRLQNLVGGKVNYYKQKPENADKWSNFYRWAVYGEAAEILIKAIYPIMSGKRKKKIEEMLAFYETKTGRNFSVTGRKYCRSGKHAWTKENIYTKKNGAVTCRLCDRENKNRWQTERRSIMKEMKKVQMLKQKEIGNG